MNIYERLEFLIRKTSFNIFKYGRRIINRYELSKSQFDIIVDIYFTSPKSLKSLCKALDLAPSTVSEMLDRMEKKDLIVKKKDKKDKRKIKIDITEQANNIIEDVINRRVEYVKEVLENVEEENLEVFKQVLMKMLECQKSLE
ncbi:MAG: MarR family transcriptional regulator [Candidatus Mcinerneyibacterium aminivorans]|uniref:MarR family transcriptional regulator n=1 Tax=Candidatus Mcinerneyibacterium aminivorans TaxID=2703815 RepID=A0A5D0MM48_9BACT|nr:MAG: MarR family transcriptional regulator [Candidatus Mcinerneyibacterium aminivorans]